MDVEGYDPETLYDEYAGAEGGTSAEKINALRRKHYAANKDKINAQKRAAYAKRKRDRLKSEPGILKKPESIKNDFGDVKPLKIQDDEREIMKSLYEKGKNNGYENGIIIYSDGVKRECCSSNPSGVRMTIDREEQKGIKLYHNHTNDSIPSKGDLEKLVDIRVDEVGVITDNREIYTVSIGYGQRPTIDEYNTVAKQISNEVRQDLMSYAGYDDWTIEERQYMFFRERTRRIAGYFEWELRGGAVDE